MLVAFVPFPGSGATARFIDTYLSFPSFLITLALLFLSGTVGVANGAWTEVTGGNWSRSLGREGRPWPRER